MATLLTIQYKSLFWDKNSGAKRQKRAFFIAVLNQRWISYDAKEKANVDKGDGRLSPQEEESKSGLE